MSIINENIAANKGIFVSSNLQQQQKTNELLKLYYRDKKKSIISSGLVFMHLGV